MHIIVIATAKEAPLAEDFRSLPHSLDFPQVEESRLAWLGEDSRGSLSRDKSVRFDLKDPWVEKKKAQEANGDEEEVEGGGAEESVAPARKKGEPGPIAFLTKFCEGIQSSYSILDWIMILPW